MQEKDLSQGVLTTFLTTICRSNQHYLAICECYDSHIMAAAVNKNNSFMKRSSTASSI